MARRKVHVTRTLAPIHFEDLEPHRFEDLVRQLIYDFRDWQSIESTGRAGSDGGFDARAYERVVSVSEQSDEDEDTLAHPMEGNQWMIQAKREKELGPSDVTTILDDVSASSPPYGYILAAAANFSKESFDLFRETLRAKGVMEFYLWGKGELEDMLYLPKNDRLLFTFFGISLITRRRSRATEIRSFISIKNKLQKLFGNTPEFHHDVLIRDVNDEHYPYEKQHPDFKERPRWIDRVAFQNHPLGFLVHSREHYAFIDRDKKEWDFVPSVSLLFPTSLSDEDRATKHSALNSVKEVWSYLPRARQATFAIEGFIRFDSVVVLDPDGDKVHNCPHIYVQFDAEHGPYDGSWERLSVGHEEIDLDDGWRRVDLFPKTFPKPKPSQVAKGKITLDLITLKSLDSYGKDAETLFATDARYDKLKPRQVVEVLGGKESHFLRIMHVEKAALSVYARSHGGAWNLRRLAAQQTGADIGDNDILTILEVERAYSHEWAKAD